MSSIMLRLPRIARFGYYAVRMFSDAPGKVLLNTLQCTGSNTVRVCMCCSGRIIGPHNCQCRLCSLLFILQGTGSGGSIRYGPDTRLFLFNAHHFCVDPLVENSVKWKWHVRNSISGSW